MSIGIRLAESGDRDTIIGLLKEIHGPAAPARYEWLYQRNPHGPALTWIAIDKSHSTAVAMTSVFPRVVFVGGDVHVGSIGGDCYVRPDARRQGIATRLHRATRDEMERHGVRLMYGPPVPHNLRALVAAGATVVTDFRRFTRLLPWSQRAPLPSRAVNGRANARRGFLRVLASRAGGGAGLVSRWPRPRDLSAYTLTPVTHFEPDWDAWSDRLRAQYAVVCARDARYLTWRYLESPQHAQIPYALRRDRDLVGLVVLEVCQTRCLIIDLCVSRFRGAFRAALALATTRAEEAGCPAIDFWCTPFAGHRQQAVLSGFMRRDRDTPWLFQVLAPAGRLADSPLGRRRSWYFTFTFGDQDIDGVTPAALGLAD